MFPPGRRLVRAMWWPGPSMALFVVSWRRGKQVENKERHFVEVAKGKYARTRVCLRMKTTDLKRFMLRFI